MERNSPNLATFLSALLPGLGQLYKGDRAKGAATLLTSVGILAAILGASFGPVAVRSRMSTLLFEVAYLFVWIPAVLDAYDTGDATGRSLLAGESRWYVVLMLVTVGPMALPLLWHSRRFSRASKVIWSAVVVVAVLLGVLFVMLAGPILEEFLRQLLESLKAGR
ncbi:MAG: hypothetical protein ACE5JX_12695 [Acidobacteriota bacterium]